MTDFRTLLERHQPLLRYDSQEAYFADAADEWTDGPEQLLRTADGAALAAGHPAAGHAQLSLAFLGATHYASGAAAGPDDRIGCTGRDYVQQARRLHVEPRYRNRMYGRWASGSDGRTWLQYWFFYFYNDYNLIGRLLPAGLHEGDWEMVQLRLDGAQQAPELAVFAQHKHAKASKWSHVERVGERPVVYPARGSHASYFTAGTHWTGVWFDHADGEGFSPSIALDVAEDGDAAYAWMRWPGYWGDTQPSGDPTDAYSPRGPGHHAQWDDPHALLLSAEDYQRFEVERRPPAPTPPPAPQVTLTRAGAVLQIAYACPGWPAGTTPAQLVVTLNSPEDPLPPTVRRVPIAAPSGSVDVAADLRANWSYAIAVSVVDSDQVASASTSGTLAAE